MKQAPYVENYRGLELHIHNSAFSDINYPMKSQDPILGTPLSKIWIQHAQIIDFNGGRGLRANAVLILRNQSDYSNLIITMGDFTLVNKLDEKTSNRMLLILTEYLFDKSNEYSKEKNLLGEDGNEFLIPIFLYTDSHFEEFVGNLK